MIKDFDMAWLRKISPTYEERFWNLVQKKHKHKRYGPDQQKLDIRKDLRKCGCGRTIRGETRYCARCLRARGFYQREHTPRGRLAERPAIPDREISWRYVV
jgi:hypothetical protein